MRICPRCGGVKVVMFDADNDYCEECKEWFSAVPDVEQIYCHKCSEAGGAERAIYHAPPVCK